MKLKLLLPLVKLQKNWGLVNVELAKHSTKREIGEYELEWLEPEVEADTKLDDTITAKRIERLKKTYTQPACTYCGKPMTREDRVKNGFGIYEIDEKTGHIKRYHEVNAIYEGNKLTGLSVSSLKNAQIREM